MADATVEVLPATLCSKCKSPIPPKLPAKTDRYAREFARLDSYAAVAKRYGVTRQTIYAILTDADAKRAILAYKERGSDKARGVLASAKQQLRRFSAIMDRIDPETATNPQTGKPLDLVTLAQLQRNALEMYGKALDLEEREGISDELPQENYDKWRRRIERTWQVAVRWGIRIGRRMSRPQDVVVPSSPPLASEPD